MLYFAQTPFQMMPVLGPRSDEYPQDLDCGRRLRAARGVEQLALHEEFESIAVDNGTKGVQTAKAGQIDLVIMDVGLPDVDGREACAFCARTASRRRSSC